MANKLSANSSKIKNAGAQYIEELKRWLTSWRWLWLWQESENYDSVNALIRICEIYDIMDIILPYQEVILEAAIRGIDRGDAVDVLYCDNPKCITSTEQELSHKFRCVSPENGIYRCLYCESKNKYNGV